MRSLTQRLPGSRAFLAFALCYVLGLVPALDGLGLGGRLDAAQLDAALCQTMPGPGADADGKGHSPAGGHECCILACALAGSAPPAFLPSAVAGVPPLLLAGGEALHPPSIAAGFFRVASVRSARGPPIGL